MDSLKIGIRLESLGLPLRRALADTARLRGPGKPFRLTRPEFVMFLKLWRGAGTRFAVRYLAPCEAAHQPEDE